MAEGEIHSEGDRDSFSADSFIPFNHRSTVKSSETQSSRTRRDSQWMNSASNVELLPLSAVRTEGAKKMSILFIGNAGVGKTSFIDRLRNDRFNENHNPTLHLQPTQIGAKIDDQYYMVYLLDTGGQERLRKALGPQYYKNGNGAVVMYDIVDFDSFDEVSMWRLEVLTHCKGETGQIIPMILVGNKVDLNKAHIDGEKIAKDSKMNGYFKTSAKTGMGVEEAIKVMISLIARSTNLQSVTNTLRDISPRYFIVHGNGNPAQTRSNDTGRSSKCNIL